MSEKKLSSDEVPQKLSDWLLAMGCPPEKVPPVEKIAQMCRGTYYLVWRSLMEQVESKDSIKQKRLQVFADDVCRCKKKNLFTEDTNVLIPPELTLWRQQVDVQRKVAETEARLAETRRDLNNIMDKVSSKMSQRNLSRQRVQDLQRRSWLLQLLAEDLRAKKQSLVETRAIAEDMCYIHDHTDVQPKLDRCLSAMQRQPGGAAVASSTMIAHNPSASDGNLGDIDEEYITQLAQCRGDALWSEIHARRAALVAALATPDATPLNNSPSFQSVLTQTAALQCSLALDALKCREMARLAQARLADAVDNLNTQLTSESCELLVLRCERARTEARVGALKSLLSDVAARSGSFHVPAECEDRQGTRAEIDRIDKAIESKKEEIKSVVASLATVDRKIQNVRECLVSIFNGFQKDVPVADIGSGTGIQLDLPTDTIESLRRFYEQRREKRRNKMELSMEFDVSECSINEDINNARFIDELRIYLKKFNLEKNRKLVLESGEKIWMFETLQASIRRVHARWQAEDVTCPLLCPSAPAQSSALRLVRAVGLRDGLRAMPRGGTDIDINIDINKHTDEEDRIIDKLKKRLDENLRNLQRTSKTLDQGKENLNLWSNNEFKNYILQQRTVDGKAYKSYEAYYLESLNF